MTNGEITILFKHRWCYSPSYIIIFFFIASSLFSTPVLYISPSLEKNVVIDISKQTIASCRVFHVTVPCSVTYVLSLGGQKYPGWSGQNNGFYCTQKLMFVKKKNAYIDDNMKFSWTRNISRQRKKTHLIKRGCIPHHVEAKKNVTRILNNAKKGNIYHFHLKRTWSQTWADHFLSSAIRPTSNTA